MEQNDVIPSHHKMCEARFDGIMGGNNNTTGRRKDMQGRKGLRVEQQCSKGRIGMFRIDDFFFSKLIADRAVLTIICFDPLTFIEQCLESCEAQNPIILWCAYHGSKLLCSYVSTFLLYNSFVRAFNPLAKLTSIQSNRNSIAREKRSTGASRIFQVRETSTNYDCSFD